MKLADFTRHLLEKGDVTVAGELVDLNDKKDLQDTAWRLKEFHAQDTLRMPGTAPEFYPAAAVWGAKYFYHAIQFTLLRELDADLINEYLPPFPAAINPKAIYSVDLTLRHLPRLFKLAKGLAPDDPLVLRFREAAANWPLSSVGIDIPAETPIEVLLSHPSLVGAYADRIIAQRDKNRLQNPAVKGVVEAALGNYAPTLWPGWQELNLTLTHGN